MDGSKVRSLSGGANQRGLRDFNERLLLSMLQRNGPMPGSDLARRAGLSPQTVSVILRKLERDALLLRGAPVRGKVGKPSVPMGLNPDGVFSFGLNIGRRNAKLLLLDFTGEIRAARSLGYRYPLPGDIFGFLNSSIAEITSDLTVEQAARICGIGVAAPFELWNWHELVGAPAEQFVQWEACDLAAQVAEITDLPVFVVNDATAACRAEHVYGRGREFRDYAYFFVATFVGGGVVLNHSVLEGNRGNAGALGSLQSVGPDGESRQLIDRASLHLLETRLQEAGLDPAGLWTQPQDWSRFSPHVAPWIDQTAQELAKAALSTCAVIDFEAVLIDGAFPDDVKTALVEQTQKDLADQDSRGLLMPVVKAGETGGQAREIGAASSPILSQYLLNSHSGIADAGPAL